MKRISIVMTALLLGACGTVVETDPPGPAVSPPQESPEPSEEPTPEPIRRQFVYVSAYATIPDAVEVYEVTDDGGLVFRQSVPVGESPRVPTADPTGRFLYVVSGDSTAGVVHQFAIDPDDGTLTALNPPTIACSGTTTSHVELAVGEDFLFVPHPGLGTTPARVSAYRRSPTGELTRLSDPSFTFEAGGMKAQWAILHPDQDRLFVGLSSLAFADPGATGTLRTYSVDPSTGALTIQDEEDLPSSDDNANIRLAYPSADFSYIFTLDHFQILLGADVPDQVTQYRVDPGGTTLLNTVITPLERTPAAMAVHPAGELVYVSNTASDTISVYDVDPATGVISPTPRYTVPTALRPSALAIDATGTRLYVIVETGVTYGRAIAQYDIDAAGVLTPMETPTIAIGDAGWRLTVVETLSEARGRATSSQTSTRALP